MDMVKVNINLLVTAVAVLVALSAVFLAFYLAAPYATRVKNVLWGVQVGVTALAVILGAYKWQVFRESEPHLTITHDVPHRPIGDSYAHIAVTGTLPPTALNTRAAARRAYRCGRRADRQVRSGCPTCRWPPWTYTR